MTYDVHLEMFEGPLDLLLYLIRKNDLEIADIPIAGITAEYLSYLDIMQVLNLEIAGEFLVMASTLMQIKARMLLPSPETEEDDGPDPLEELKAKLIEYQKFKEVAQIMGAREIECANFYYRRPPVFDKEDFVLDVSLFDLIEGFRAVLQELPNDIKEIVYKEIPIEEKIRQIMDIFDGRSFITFSEILKHQHTRHDLIVCFMAVLELIRLKQIIGRQSRVFDEIRVYRVGDDQPGPPLEEETPLPAQENVPETIAAENTAAETPAQDLPVTETTSPKDSYGNPGN